jgi:hypothetical protein
MTDIAKIAAGLSKAQMETLKSLGIDWQSAGRGNASGFALWGRGLAEKQTQRGNNGPLYRLTFLGQQVRDYLKEQHHD